MAGYVQPFSVIGKKKFTQIFSLLMKCLLCMHHFHFLKLMFTHPKEGKSTHPLGGHFSPMWVYWEVSSFTIMENQPGMGIHCPILFQKLLEGAENLSPIAFWPIDVDIRIGVHSDRDPAPEDYKIQHPVPYQVHQPPEGVSLQDTHSSPHTEAQNKSSPPGSCHQWSWQLYTFSGRGRWKEMPWEGICQEGKMDIFIEEEIHSTKEIRQKDHKGLWLAKPISRCLQEINSEVREDLLWCQYSSLKNGWAPSTP